MWGIHHAGFATYIYYFLGLYFVLVVVMMISVWVFAKNGQVALGGMWEQESGIALVYK